MSSPADFFSTHRSRLDEAVEATRTRGYYSAFPESPSPKVYGENAATDGAAAFEAWLGGDFPLATPGADGTVPLRTLDSATLEHGACHV